MTSLVLAQQVAESLRTKVARHKVGECLGLGKMEADLPDQVIHVHRPKVIGEHHIAEERHHHVWKQHMELEGVFQRKDLFVPGRVTGSELLRERGLLIILRD